MKRVGRWAFNILAGMSLLLCLMVVGLWLRSYHVGDAIIHNRQGGWFRRVMSCDGDVAIQAAPNSPYTDTFCYVRANDRGDFRMHVSHGPRPGLVGSDGVFWQQGWHGSRAIRRGRIDRLGGPDRYYTNIYVPLWPFALVTAALPLSYGFRLWQARRRRLHSMCPVCSYDLRATPDRCPECGTVVSRLAAAGKE